MNAPIEPLNPELRKELEDALLINEFEWLTQEGQDKFTQPVPDDLLIATFLLKGSAEDWTKLKSTYPSDVLFHLWIEQLIMNELYDSRHRRIAEFFFGIKNPVLFIRQHRTNQLEGSEKSDGKGKAIFK